MIHNIRSFILVVTTLALISCGNSSTSNSELFVIYGADNRLEMYETNEATQTLARSTVALVETSALDYDEQSQAYSHEAESYEESHATCENTPFKEQPTLAYCSGFLIRSDIIVTAGHCITNSTDCENTSFVLDYALNYPSDQNSPKNIPEESVFSCAEVLHTEETVDGADFAIIKLDRDITDRPSLHMHTSRLKRNSPLTLIGYPVGLPVKISANASVRSINDQYFVTNTDSFGGNSGSAIINSTTNEVEGILVRGEDDFIGTSDQCRREKRCQDHACRGEDGTLISEVVERMDILGL